jgi:hypothetical protein
VRVIEQVVKRLAAYFVETALDVRPGITFQARVRWTTHPMTIASKILHLPDCVVV